MTNRRRLSRAQLRTMVTDTKNTTGNGLWGWAALSIVLSHAWLAIDMIGALFTWNIQFGYLPRVLVWAIASWVVIGLLTLSHRSYWRNEAARSGLSPDEADELWKLGKALERWRTGKGPPPATDTPVVVYMAVGPKDLAGLRSRDWAELPSLERPGLYLTSSYKHARNMARSWFADQGAGIGFVLKLKLKAQFLAKASRQEIGPDDIEEFWAPDTELEALNAALIDPPKKAAAVRPSSAPTESAHA